MIRNAILAGLVAFILLPAAAVEPAAPQQQENPSEKPTDASIWDQLQALYDAAREAGDIDAEGIAEWLKSDYESVGDWEYRIIQVDSRESGTLEAALNHEGQDRWEVFWVREGRGSFTFFLKRPARSYLRSIPLADLLKLVPGGGGE